MKVYAENTRSGPELAVFREESLKGIICERSFAKAALVENSTYTLQK